MDHPNHTDHAKADSHAGQPSAGATRRTASPWRVALVALVVVPVMLACTNTVSLDSAPASSLTVSVMFENALVLNVNVNAYVIVKNNTGDNVELTGGQTFSIDGVKIPTHGDATIPRQPSGAGSFYTLTYTDEHGKKTSVRIAAPPAAESPLAVATSPAKSSSPPIGFSLSPRGERVRG